MARFDNRLSIQLKNDSVFTDASLRAMLAACFGSLGLGGKRQLHIKAGRRNGRVSGRATVRGRWMMLCIPPIHDPLTVARVLHHEALHNLGAQHEDMTKEQRYCQASWKPSWWREELVLVRSTTKAPTDEAKRLAVQKKLKAAHEGLARANRRAKLAATWQKKWKRKLAGLEQALRAMDARASMQATVLLDGVPVGEGELTLTDTD